VCVCVLQGTHHREIDECSSSIGVRLPGAVVYRRGLYIRNAIRNHKSNKRLTLDASEVFHGVSTIKKKLVCTDAQLLLQGSS